MVPLAAMAEVGINASYDPATLQLRFSIPVARQGSQVVSILPSQSPARGLAVVPANFSASATFSVNQTYVWQSDYGNKGFEKATVSADLAANLGGEDGVSMLGQLEYSHGQAKAFRRGNFQLVHDDVARAIRYSAGDVAPTSAGYQSSPLMGGVSIERQYGNLQPLRSIRPSGQYTFVLDRESTVDVVVNGATLRTLQLKPGQYNLRDFPFFNGLNQVELYAIDSAGRRLLANFSQYYSARLIDKGVFEFGATGGFLQNTGASTGKRYLGDAPVFSGYVRYGLASSLTLGANAQFARNQWNVGFESAVATQVGTFGLLAAASEYRGAGRGTSLLASYEGAFKGGGFLRQIRVNLEAERTSRRFTPITTSIPLNKVNFRLSGRLSAVLPGKIGIGFSSISEFGRDGEPDHHRQAFNLSRNIGGINLTGSYERDARRGQGTDNRFLVSASIPLGRSRTLRSAYDSRGNLASLELSQYRRDELDTLGFRASLNRDDNAVNAVGEADYANNRFGLQVRHRAIGTASGRITSQETEYTASTEVALANGTLAIGRPVGPRFAIVEAHPTLGGAAVDVWQGPVRERPQARAGRTGPALVSLGSPYLPTQIRVDVRNAPAGYDIGPGAYSLNPGAATGFRITIGSEASRIVMGVLVDAQGNPLSLLGGSLVPVGKPNATPILFFTNANGRFVANGIAPGDYMLSIGDDASGHAVISVPRAMKANPSIGTVHVEGLLAPASRPADIPPSTIGKASTSPDRTARDLSAAPAPAAPAPVSAPRTHSAISRFHVQDTIAEAVCGLDKGESGALIEGWLAQGTRELKDKLATDGLVVDDAMLEQIFVALMVDHATSHFGEAKA